MPLQLRFLGEVEVARAGVRVDLPQSKKTRALLAYLALTARTHRRDRLCSLLWDIADDPRAALRWSVSKLRSVVEDGAVPRIVADRQHVTFTRADVWIDVLHVKEALAGGVANLSTEALQELERHFRGEFLEDVELSDYGEFNAWQVAYREELRALRESIDAELKCRRPVAAAALAADQRGSAVSHDAPRLVGRERELAAFERLLERHQTRILVITGDHGLGKSRLLAEFAARVRERQGIALEGRSFEAEAGRPFGPWLDALKRIPGLRLDALVAEQKTRDQLFETLSGLVAGTAQRTSPFVVMFDDVQWLDASSAELLHYVARMNRSAGVVFILAARGGELLDNVAALRVLRGLRREGLVDEIDLPLLTPDETKLLVAAAAPRVDPARIVSESGGNPLYALELARATPDDGVGGFSRLVRDRVERLPEEAAEVLRWCAILGGSFSLGDVERASGMPAEAVLRAIEVLERRDFLRAGSGTRDGYAFVQDLVRRAVVQELSEARTRLMHLRVANVLEDIADVARHAALGGDVALAARSCLEAARRCLRLFAGAESDVLARRGLQYASSLPDRERVPLLLELHEVRFAARRPEDIDALASEVEALAEQALDLDLAEHARLGFHILAYLRWEVGGTEDARRHMMRAELVSRTAGPAQRVVAMAEAARCLVLLERDLPEAEAMVLEARAQLQRAGLEPVAIPDALGMLRLHQRQFDLARASFERALELARASRDRMGEFAAIEHLVMVEIESGSYSRGATLAAEMKTIARKLRDGSEAPIADALAGLCVYALGDGAASAVLEASIDRLRDVDAKQRLTYVLTRAAEVDLRHGNPAAARRRAEEALRLAEIMERPSDVARARAILEKE